VVEIYTGTETRIGGTEIDRMKNIYQGPWFTVRFADNRIIPPFHLDGIEAGRR
jgi:hypothetical protein